jgi:outer membrane lipoprotein carrier protein
VIRFALWCALLADPAFVHGAELETLIHKTEARYNKAQSLKLDFSETYTGIGRPVQSESGVLYLRKPGRMRWEYTMPPGKLFLSDGKEVYLYVPGERRAERQKLRESADMRAPLAFLLGKLDFSKEFKSLKIRDDGQNQWIVAEPKSQNLAYTEVEFRALPTGEIRNVRVTGQDRSKLEFTFSNEQLNAPVSPSLFVFNPPAGVEVVEAEP